MTGKEKMEYEKKIVVPLRRKMWERLRKMAFDKETSMNEIVRKSIAMMIRKNKKKS